MSGALLLLAMAAAADIWRSGSLAAWRGLGFIALTGSTCVLMTGLPEYLFDITDDRLLLPAKVALGPLSGALALMYLGIWLGRAFEDSVLRVSVIGGAFALLASAVAMILWSLLDTRTEARQLIAVSAVVNLVSVVLALMAAVRGVMLGDNLARWMVLACLCLAVMVLGLYAHALEISSSFWLWVVTALGTVAYFLIVIVLTLQRNQAQKRLQRIARGNHFTDDVTGLPKGSLLLSKVDDAMWRSARRGRDSAVIAIWFHNIYDLSHTAGLEVEHEIRVRLTALLRQAVGFRNVVGHLQARCFLVAVSAVDNRDQVDRLVARILSKMSYPMRVGYLGTMAHDFVPEFGIGVVHVPCADHGEPLQAIDKAQRLAQQASKRSEIVVQQELVSQVTSVASSAAASA